MKVSEDEYRVLCRFRILSTHMEHIEVNEGFALDYETLESH